MSDTKLSSFWGNSGHATGPSPEEYCAKLQELTKQLQRCTADLARAQQHLDSFSAISATTEQSRNAEEALLTLKSVSTDLLAAQHAILSITSSSSFARRRSFSQPFGSHLHAAAGIGVDTSRVSSEMLPEKVQDANKRIMLLKSENTRLRMQIQNARRQDVLTTQVKHVFSSPPPAISQPYIDGLLSTASRSKQQEVFTMPSLQVKRVSSSQLSNASPAFGSMPEMRGSTRTSITFEPTEEEEEGDEDSMTFWTAEELPDNDPTVLRASSWRHPAIVSAARHVAGNGKRPNTAGALLDFLKNKVLFFGNGMGKLLSGTRTPPRTTGSDSGTFATASHSRRSTASSPGTTRRNIRISTAMAHDGTASLASKEMPESTLADMARRSRSESSMSTWRRRALEFDGVASAQRALQRCSSEGGAKDMWSQPQSAAERDRIRRRGFNLEDMPGVDPPPSRLSGQSPHFLTPELEARSSLFQTAAGYSR